LVIKSRRLAYDGRGNAVAYCKEDITAAVSGKVQYLPVHANWKGIKNIDNFINEFKESLILITCYHLCYSIVISKQIMQIPCHWEKMSNLFIFHTFHFSKLLLPLIYISGIAINLIFILS